MIKNNRDIKRTANQLAKELIVEYGERAYYWSELMRNYPDMTQAEVDEVDRFVDKHFWRVAHFLNAYPHNDSGRP